MSRKQSCIERALGKVHRTNENIEKRVQNRLTALRSVQSRSERDRNMQVAREKITCGKLLSHCTALYPTIDEASATSGILLEHIGPDVYRTYEHGIFSLSDFSWSSAEVGVHAALRASVDILVLSSGCLESLKFLSIVCEVAGWWQYADTIMGGAPKTVRSWFA